MCAHGLKDPDGGAANRTIRVSTRPVPADMPNAPVKQVTPKTFAAEMQTARPGDVWSTSHLGSPGRVSATRRRQGSQPVS